jgi:hypothetical protein
MPYEVKSDTAVITLGVGEKGQQWLELSEPSMRAYAERIGADFHKITDSTMLYPFGEKWRVGQFLDCYSRIIFLDADIIVRDSAPNLFDLVPENTIGLHDDLPYNSAGYAWYFTETEQVQRSQGFRLQALPYCLNTGIIVIGQQHKDIFNPPEKPFQALHCFEQHLINCRIFQNNYPVFKLPVNIHWQHWLDKQRKIYDQGQFLHFSGELDHKARLKMMRDALPKNKKDCGCKKKKLADPTRIKALLSQAKKSGFAI